MTTSWGSFFAALTGIVGAVTPFVPPQYQVWGSIFAGVFGAIATKIP